MAAASSVSSWAASPAAARDAQMRALVAKYLPTASRRGGGNLVAETADAPTMQAQAIAQPAEAAVAATGGSFNLPNNGPVPDFRYSGETTQSIEVAYAEPVKVSANPVLNENIMPNTLEAQSRKTCQGCPGPGCRCRQPDHQFRCQGRDERRLHRIRRLPAG